MPRELTSNTTLDNLRKEAKRWLKAIRDNDVSARERLMRAYPKAPDIPVLRDLQHALACEYGAANWTELKHAVEAFPAARRQADEERTLLVRRFLEHACPDHHVRTRAAHRIAEHAAMRLLDQHPQVARDSIYAAVVCGEVDEVERLLRANPQLANTKHPAQGPSRSGPGNELDFLGELGAKEWEPLLYLCFTRLPLPKANENAAAIARLLLDHGANPNAYFMAGDSRYTPLVGAIGEGEENRPPHARRDELVRLLLDRGAAPYDNQVIYNIHFQGKVLWWLKLIYEHSLKLGRRADWDDPEWEMIGQGGYGTGARCHLRIAVEHNDIELAKWCLEHGATPNPRLQKNKVLPQWSLYEQAVRLGNSEIAELLLQHGAEKQQIVLADEDQFAAACLRLDRDEMKRLLAQHSEFLQSPKALFAAAEKDREDVVGLLLDLGAPIEVQDAKEQHALHMAASYDAVNVGRLLVERGAEIDPHELDYGATPLDFAIYGGHQRMIELLRRSTRNVWNLVRLGEVDRLREVLTAEPQRAKATWQTTPLFDLPEDEDAALEIVKLMVEHGADAGFRTKKGSTAAEIARKRGMLRAAAALEAASSGESDSAAARGDYMIATYEELAHDLVKAFQADDAEAMERLGQHIGSVISFDKLRENIRARVDRLRQAAQRGEEATLELDEAREVIARHSGFDSWAALLEHASASESRAASESTPAARKHHQAAQDFVSAYGGDETALQRLNAYYEREFSFEDIRAEIWRRVYAFRQRSSRVPRNFLQLSEAQMMVAQDAGFGSWDALMEADRAATPPPGAPYVIYSKDNRIEPRRRLTQAEWDSLIGAAEEQRVARIDANGLMTDRALARIAKLGHVTEISLGGSRELTNDGLLHLAEMPQLESLDMSEYPGGKLTDRGLEVLRHLPNLRTFDMAWQSGVTDAGIANLRFCKRLESVNLMGSPTGDGAIEALQGKPNLRRFSTGRLVTDAGLPLLHNFPQLKTWRGPQVDSYDEESKKSATRLLLDGPFTNSGLASIAGLEGVFELDLFWHVSAITTDALVHLRELPNLGALGCDGKLSDNTAMRHIAAIPRLRRLRAQESEADDDGFAELSRSQSLESLWGRECEHFGSRGFTALSKMPRLRTLGIGCRKVDDAALSLLPSFPALRELTPIGLNDDGFRHVGRCVKLERLTCMYCRDTTDIATEHIAGLKLKYYYAGLTKITDRSLATLGRMDSLEQIELYECNGVTDAGIAHLAGLPHLREVHLNALPGVTLGGTQVFPRRVHVHYST